MATSQPGYQYQGAGQHEQAQYDQYGVPQQPEYADNASPVQGGPPQSNAARRKRQYAGQAYDFGGGANSALGGQPQGGGGYPGPPGAGYGGYGQQPQQPALQQPMYGASQGAIPPPVAATYGQPPAPGGYQPPEPGYPPHGAAPLSPGMGGITQGMNSMGIGGQPPQPGQHIQQRPQLNQLYPTDLLNQPLNIAELDLPPPPIILPPNVRGTCRVTFAEPCLHGYYRQASLRHHTLIAHRSMSGQL